MLISRGPEPGQGGGAGRDAGKARTPPQGEQEEIPSGLRRIFGGNWRETARYADAAYTLVGGILGLGFVGWLVDRWFETRPGGVLIGILVGCVVGFYRLGRVMLARR